MVLAGWKGWLYLLVGVWAYYHVIRQHYGFMVLYKVKNRDLAPAGQPAGPLFPGRDDGGAAVPPLLHSPSRGTGAAVFACRALEGSTVGCWWRRPRAVYLARQWMRWRAGESACNLPKYLLFAAVIPLHWLTFAYMSWQAAVPTVTIVHNLQYHAIVWFHNRNRYGGAGGLRAARPHSRRPSSRSLLAYAAMGLVFSALYRIPGFALGQVSDLAFGFFCGFGLTHYYLDSRIWRVRHDPGLRQALQLA